MFIALRLAQDISDINTAYFLYIQLADYLKTNMISRQVIIHL